MAPWLALAPLLVWVAGCSLLFAPVESESNQADAARAPDAKPDSCEGTLIDFDDLSNGFTPEELGGIDFGGAWRVHEAGRFGAPEESNVIGFRTTNNEESFAFVDAPKHLLSFDVYSAIGTTNLSVVDGNGYKVDVQVDGSAGQDKIEIVFGAPTASASVNFVSDNNEHFFLDNLCYQ